MTTHTESGKFFWKKHQTIEINHSSEFVNIRTGINFKSAVINSLELNDAMENKHVISAVLFGNMRTDIQ